MRRATTGGLVLVLALSVAVILPWCTRQLEVDGCLDSGGRWNDDRCERE